VKKRKTKTTQKREQYCRSERGPNEGVFEGTLRRKKKRERLKGDGTKSKEQLSWTKKRCPAAASCKKKKKGIRQNIKRLKEGKRRRGGTGVSVTPRGKGKPHK